MEKKLLAKFKINIDAFILSMHVLPVLAFLVAMVTGSSNLYMDNFLLQQAEVILIYIMIFTPFVSMVLLIHKGPEWILARPILKWLVMFYCVLALLQLSFIVRVVAIPFSMVFGMTLVGNVISFCAFIPILIIWWRVSKPLWRSVFDRKFGG